MVQMKHVKTKKKFSTIVFLIISLSLMICSRMIRATEMVISHIGTFEGETTFQLNSENGILPILELEVENRYGEIETYEIVSGSLTIPETKEGTKIKKARLKGRTIDNLFPIDGVRQSLPKQWTESSVGIFDYVHSETPRDAVTGDVPLSKPLEIGKTYLLKQASERTENCASLGFVFPNETTGSWFQGIQINSGTLTPTGNAVKYSPKVPIKTLRMGRWNNSYIQNSVVTIKYPMLFEYIEGMEKWEIVYFEGNQSVEAPILTMMNKDKTKKSQLKLSQAISLSSNGEVYDELDLLTGKLIKRIGEDGSVLDQEEVEIIPLETNHRFPPTVEVHGEIGSVLGSITVPTHELTFVLDTNQEIGRQFIAPEFEVANESNAPLNLILKTFEQTSVLFNDVPPTQYESWTGLTKEESKDIALGLVAKASTDWLNYIEEPHYVNDTNNTLLGTIKPKGTVEFEFIAHHGQAFDEILNPSYRLTFVFDLLR